LYIIWRIPVTCSSCVKLSLNHSFHIYPLENKIVYSEKVNQRQILYSYSYSKMCSLKKKGSIVFIYVRPFSKRSRIWEFKIVYHSFQYSNFQLSNKKEEKRLKSKKSSLIKIGTHVLMKVKSWKKSRKKLELSGKLARVKNSLEDQVGEKFGYYCKILYVRYINLNGSICCASFCFMFMYADELRRRTFSKFLETLMKEKVSSCKPHLFSIANILKMVE